jgi:hypothetical protein
VGATSDVCCNFTKYEKCIGIIQWGDPGVDGRIILGWIFRKWDVEGMEWIGLAQDRDR